MVYVSGRPDHKMSNEEMVDHLVGLVENEAKNVRDKQPDNKLGDKNEI
jgi:(E)-4-hydroxy-3-methylbut-2-enyl-diphosphate synthase